MEKLIFLIICMLSILSILLFRKKNQRLGVVHENRKRRLKEQVDTHKKQIQKRHDYLNTYKLLVFNLEESLHVQEEIDLYFK